MAIQDSFDISNALNSQSYAYKCWYNYNYGRNTMQISASDMGRITQTWNSQLDNWKAVALDDENAYEIEDDDFSTAKKSGRDNVKEKTGYDGNNTGSCVRAGGDFVVTAGLALGGKKLISNSLQGAGTKLAAGYVQKTAEAAGKQAVEKAGEEGIKKAGEEAIKNAGGDVAKATSEEITKAGTEELTKQGAEEGTKEATKDIGKRIGGIVGCTLGAATAVAYWAKKPNKEEKEACDVLQDEMVTAQTALYAAQGDMDEEREKQILLADEAQALNEEANVEIEEQKAEYDMYRATYDALTAKSKAGGTLSDDEKETLKALAPMMVDLGEGIAVTQEETTVTTGEIYDEMGTSQYVYDQSASTVGEVQGLTDYAESFDSATRTMCYVEAAAQGLNAATTAKAAKETFALASSGGPFTAWMYGFAVLGAAGAASSVVATGQQFQWAGDVGTEIGLRSTTQDDNLTTDMIYDESIENYDAMMTSVEELEIEMPEDLEDVDAIAEEINEGTAAVLSSSTANTATVQTSGTSATQDSVKKDKPKEKDV